MKQIHRIVRAYINSAESYFNTKRVIDKRVEHPRGLYGPFSDRPERWDYTDIRDLTKQDFNTIVLAASQNVDWDLFNVIPSTSLKAALDYTIHTFDKGRYASKIDAPTYKCLLNLLEKSFGEGKKCVFID